MVPTCCNCCERRYSEHFASFESLRKLTPMKVTVFGATGLLGKPLMREWRGDELTGLGQVEADLRNADQVQAVVQKTNPDWIILAAAYTDVDGCESNQGVAFAVNRD